MRSRTAEKNVDSLMDRYNQNPQSLVFSRLADEFRKEGNFSKAIELCTNGLQAHPEYVTGRIVLGQCYVEQGNPQAAIQELLTIFTYDRKNQAAMKMLADLYARQEKLDKAGDLYTLLYRMDPGNKSLRVLSKQFQSTGFNDIYEILGLPSPQTSFNFQSKEVRQDRFPSDINKTYVEASQPYNNEQNHPVTDELEMPYGTEELSSSQVTSDEIGVRMDALFGDLQSELSNPMQQLQDDSTNLNLVEDVDNLEDKGITGDDVTDRMNALFGNDDKKETSQEIAESSFSNSEITEISGDDLSLRLDMLDQKNSGIEELSMQSFQPDFHLENEQSDVINIQADLSDSSVSGNDITDSIDRLLCDVDDGNQPDFAAPLTMDIPSSIESNQISGDDVSAQLERLMPSDSFDSDLSFDSNQDTDIKENTAFSSPEVLQFSEEPLSGNDFVSRMEEITDGKDSSYNGNESENLVGDELLSTEQVELSKYTNDDVSGDDFSSRIDSIISVEETVAQSQPIVDMQENEFNDDTKSVPKEGALLFEDISEDNKQSTFDDLSVKDKSYTENLGVNTDLIVEVNESNIPSEGMAFMAPDVENPSGDDFSFHINRIIGNDNDKYLSQSQNNLLSDPEDDADSSDNTGLQISGEERLTGEDVSNQFDSMLGLKGQIDNKSNYVKPTQSFDNQYDTGFTAQNDQLLSDDDDSLSGDDFSAHIDLISGEITQNNQSTQDVQGPDLKNITRAFSKDELITSDDAVSGDDLIAHIDNVTDSDTYVPAVDYQNNANDLLSPFTNSEFEETLQFDRSIIDRVQAEIEAGQLDGVNTKNIEPEVSEEVVDISTNTDNYFGVENETLSFDRAELNAFIPDSVSDVEEIVDQPGSANQNLSDRLILNVDNPSPNMEPQGEIEDVLVDRDEKMISEMDVLVSSVEDIQGVTGEDVVQKLDALFPSDSMNVGNSFFSESKTYQAFNLSNAGEMVSEAAPDVTELSQDDKDQNNASRPTFLSKSIFGNNVEKRIDNFFGDSTISSGIDDKSFVSKSVQVDKPDLSNEVIINKPIDGTFGTITHEEDVFISEEEPQIDDLRLDDDAITFVDSTESLDPEVQSDLLPEVPIQMFVKPGIQSHENLNISEPQMTTIGAEESDKPFSIPDHVLTPTLADIYYQQGQLRLAVQIYSRLLEKDPDNQKLSDRLEEIQSKIAQQETELPVENSFKRKEMIENLKQVSGIIKSVPQKKRTIESERPLSGVRIKKGKKPRKSDQN
jgi:tetratricopeptide (TPR) repeat protein